MARKAERARLRRQADDPSAIGGFPTSPSPRCSSAMGLSWKSYKAAEQAKKMGFAMSTGCAAACPNGAKNLLRKQG